MTRFTLTLLATLLFSLPALAQKKDIVDTAVAAGNFNTLATALTKAGLVDTLKGKGPFTVFAPTDAAFAKVPSQTIKALLKPKNKDLLTSILTYHVATGNLGASAVVGKTGLATVNGQRFSITKKEGSYYVDNAKIYHARALKLACTQLNIKLLHRPPRDPPAGGLIERIFQTLQGQLEAEIRAARLLSLGDINRGDELGEQATTVVIDRQALHAHRISFDHPLSGKALTLEAPIPDDIRGLLELLQRYR